MKPFIKMKALILITRYYCNTALIRAALLSNNIEIIKLLLNASVDIDKQNKSVDTVFN